MSAATSEMVVGNEATDTMPMDQDSDAESHASDTSIAADLMVTSRARRVNAGNRMSTLLAQHAEEEEAWGEDWEEVANEEEFAGDDVNEAEDYNMDSSESDEDMDAANDDNDDAGEKELRKAERRERIKKRKTATNPFAARLPLAARKRVKIDPSATTDSTPSAPARPKKKSERASWIPTEEDGPIRTSSRRQTVANKESTLAKLQEKDRRRDDTLAMMKAAEARKKKDEPKPLTQAERLAEAARQERINKKTLHRWEEAEEARAADRQAKIDALKNRHIEGPFIRYYSGPAIYVDDKLKYTGKDAPSLDYLEEKLNREPAEAEAGAGAGADTATTSQTVDTTTQHTITATAGPQTPHDVQPPHDTQPPHDAQPPPMSSPDMFSIPASQSLQQDTNLPWASGSQAANGHVFMGGDVFMGSSHDLSYNTTSNTMFAPQTQDSFLFGIDQYATSQSQPSDLPPNPFLPQLPPLPPATTANNPPLPPPPRRKVIRRAMRTLLTLHSFPHLDTPAPSRSRTPASALKDRDRTTLIHLCRTLFSWSAADASRFVTTMLAAHLARTQKARDAHAASLRPPKQLCAVTNAVARYRDPETGIAYRDARAFGVLRGVVGGGFVWAGELGCYVGGRAKPLEKMGGKGFLGMPPAAGVPRRFLEMAANTGSASTGSANTGTANTNTGSAAASVGVGVGVGMPVSAKPSDKSDTPAPHPPTTTTTTTTTTTSTTPTPSIPAPAPAPTPTPPV